MRAATPRFADRIAAARQAVDLVELIGATVRLQPRGTEFLGLCPFHAEKTPSFTVVPAKGFYKCFGCGAKGSAIDWVMQTRQLGFREAVDWLLARAGACAPRRAASKGCAATRATGGDAPPGGCGSPRGRSPPAIRPGAISKPGSASSCRRPACCASTRR